MRKRRAPRDSRGTRATSPSRLGNVSVATLQEQLHHRYATRRCAAALAFAGLGCSEAVPWLRPLTKDQDYRVRAATAIALGRLDDVGSVSTLISLLDDKHLRVRAAAATTLGNIGDVRAIRPLIETFRDRWRDRWRHRDGVYGALAAIGLPSVGPVIAVLQDEDPRVRACAAVMLGQFKRQHVAASGPRYVAAVITALQDKDPGVRACAADTLGKLQPRRAMPALVRSLKDRFLNVRRAARRALGRFGRSRAKMLCAYIADRSVWIRKGIVDALQEMQAADELFGLLSHRDPVTRVHAAQVLGRLKDPRAQDPRVYEALCRALQSEHSGQIRNGFIEVCQRMKAAEDPRAFDVLCLALRTNDWLIRRSAARELGSYGDRRAVPFLTPLLKDPASTVRHVSAWAIRDLGGSGAADALAVETDSSI